MPIEAIDGRLVYGVEVAGDFSLAVGWRHPPLGVAGAKVVGRASGNGGLIVGWVIEPNRKGPQIGVGAAKLATTSWLIVAFG
jgi:hypothetical protein